MVPPTLIQGPERPVIIQEDLLVTLRHQTRIVLHITSRDVTKRVAVGMMILFICWYGGARLTVLGTALAILVTEVIVLVTARFLPDRDEAIPVSLIVTVWATNAISTVAYLWPAVLMAQQTSVALLLTGFMWMFGIFVHISNTFVALPLYNWSQMIPGFLTAIYAIWIASFSGYTSNNNGEWLLLMALMVVYATNTFETLNQQKDTQRALNAARAEANARLKALEHMTRHDGLTGLYNRQAFDEELGHLLDRNKPGSHVAVFLLDLDGFKPINDTYSHDAGDTVLVAIGQRLDALASPTGLAARLGGDEFALAFPGVSSDRAALRLATRIIRDIEMPIAYGEKFLRIAASVGISLTGFGEDTVAALCSGADQAMYRAKGENGARAVLYDPTAFPVRLSLKDRQTLIEAIRTARIRPHYQPKVCLRTGVLSGFEALARWDHPTRGLLSPDAFLPQINELGLQGDFLLTMARHVLSDVAILVGEGFDPGQVSINMPDMALATHSSRLDLDRLITTFPAALPHLTFEITEDVFIARAGDIIKDSIAHFRRAGVRISLDDFGTGFASFQHLRQLEFDELKIDTSFVRDLGHDPAATVLVDGFLCIARGLGVDVIAEGVETETQRDILLSMGCRHAQGYLFGRAMPLDETRIRLAAGGSRLPPVGTAPVKAIAGPVC
jgi:diguanylate cyclase